MQVQCFAQELEMNRDVKPKLNYVGNFLNKYNIDTKSMFHNCNCQGVVWSLRSFTGNKVPFSVGLFHMLYLNMWNSWR